MTQGYLSTRLCNLGLFVVALACHAQSFQTPQAQQAEPKLVHVTGIVVNSATGAGVPHALVQAGSPNAMPVLTGADGRFEFPAVQEGQYLFTANKPSFFIRQEIDGDPVQPPLVTVHEGLADVRIQLVPQATLDGHITDENGDPVEGAQIQIFRNQVENGRKKWQQTGGATSDETGGYHIGNLRPGAYALHVAGNDASNLPRQAGQKFDLVLGRSYYPGATSIEQAAPIRLVAGEQEQLDLSMKHQPGYRISGTVSQANQGNAFVMLKPQGEDDNGQGMQAAVLRNGVFRLASVPSGSYSLIVMGQGGETPSASEISVVVSDSDVTGLQFILEPGLTVPVQLTVTRTHSQDAAAAPLAGNAETFYSGRNAYQISQPGDDLGNISLTSEGSMSFGQSSIPLHEVHSAEDALLLKNVHPGRYRLQSFPNGGFYVESANCGGVDLLDSPLVVEPGVQPPPIQLSLRDDFATLVVQVFEDGKTKQGMVLAISAKGAQSIGVGTSFPLQLAPGTYKLYAFDHIADLEYANPEVMRQYSASAKEVTLEPHGKTTVTLELIHRGAP